MDNRLYIAPLNRIDPAVVWDARPKRRREWRDLWKIVDPPGDPGVLIPATKAFIEHWTGVLSTTTDRDHRTSIKTAVSCARQHMGGALYQTNDQDWESELALSVIEAEEAGDPTQSFQSSNALAGIYSALGRYDEAQFLYMRSIAYAAVLGARTMDLLMHRLARMWLHEDFRGDPSATMNEMCGVFAGMPLHALLNRARRLAAIGQIDNLRSEADLDRYPLTCWHIGRAAAADRILGNEERWVSRLHSGLALAKKLRDRIWKESFNSFIAQR